MNHDFDNEFETDDELKRGRSRRKDGRKYASSGLTGSNRQYRKRQPDCKDGSQVREKPLRTITFLLWQRSLHWH